MKNKAQRKIENLDIVAEILTLSGPPALLSTERKAEYETLLCALVKAVEPNDAVEMLWTRDIVDYCFEIRRLRQIRVGLVESARQDERENIRAWLEGEGADFNPEEEDCDAGKGDFMSPLQHDARFFVKNLQSWEQLSRMLSRAEKRVSKTLVWIENRRASRAEQLRRSLRDAIGVEPGQLELPSGRTAATQSGPRSDGNSPRALPGTGECSRRRAG